MTAPSVPRLRHFEPQDAAAIASVFRAAVAAIEPALYSAAEREAWAARADPARLGARCAAARTWVAEVEGEVGGYIACEPDGHVDLAFVHPTWQGRGVGRALHEAVEAEARRRRLGRLFTEASHPARPFFERAGYRVLGEDAAPVGDLVLTRWRMARRLVPLEAADRIFVVGNSGSGKTTFARRLAGRMGRPALDLDTVAFADQRGTRRAIEDSVARLSTARGFDDRPVIEGCYADLVRALAGPGDHLVWLDLSVEACVDNARARPWEPHKWPSAEAQDAFLPNLVAFIEGYPADPSPTGRPAHAALFEGFPGAREARRARPTAEVAAVY